MWGMAVSAAGRRRVQLYVRHTALPRALDFDNPGAGAGGFRAACIDIGDWRVSGNALSLLR